MRRLRLLLLTTLLTLLVGLLVVPAHGQVPTASESTTESESEAPPTHTVEVRDDGYAPAELTIAPGDRVQWVWVGEGPHTVTAQPDATNARAFDSHPDCSRNLFGEYTECGRAGDTYAVTFEGTGRYRYASRVEEDEHAGTIYVETPPPSPSPTPTTSPSPSPSPSPTPSPTASPSPSPSPSPSTQPPLPTPDPTPTTEPTTASPSPTSSPSPQRGSAPRFTQAPVPSPTQIEPPVVAGSEEPTSRPTSSEPEFDDFPSLEAGTESDADDPDEVVIAAGDTGGPGRGVWGFVGGGFLLATLGAFGRLVLFGDAWS